MQRNNITACTNCRTESRQPKGDGCHACQAGVMENAIYHEGFNAFLEGAERMDNPYHPLFEYSKHQEWRTGYMAANQTHISYGVFA